MATTEAMRWGSHYATGVAKIDQEHELLVLLLNRLNGAFMAEEPEEQLQALLATFIDTTRAHFHTEEQLMEEAAYPERDLHAAEHEFLLSHAAQFQSEYFAGHDHLSESVLDYLKDWLRNHIVVADRRLGRFLTGNSR